MDFSFSGAGFMGCYYFGVVDGLNRYIPRNRINRVAGTSAGSLIAAYYLLDLPLQDCLHEIITMTEDIRKRPLGVFDRNHKIVDILSAILHRTFPEDAHKRVSNRLHVCMTRLKPFKKVIVNEFDSKKDLIDALNCSSFIPGWSGNHVPTYKGIKHIDGGFTDQLPVFDENTIKICCFAGPTDISPFDKVKLVKSGLSASILNMPVYFNLANMRRARRALTPPPASYILDLLERGFDDTKQFILNNDLIQCQSCYLKNDPRNPLGFLKSTTISPYGSPAISPAGSRSFGLNNTISDEDGDENSDSNDNSNTNDSGRSSQDLSISRLESTTPDHSFNGQLSAKLRRYSLCENELTINNNNTSDAFNYPEIIIEDTELEDEETKQNKSLSGGGSCASSTLADKLNSSSSSSSEISVSAEVLALSQWKERFIARRATLASSDQSLLVVKDLFKSTSQALPSRPPSPSLNRHCQECLRLREEAKVDHIENKIRDEAAKFLPPQVKEAKNKRKISSPLKWIRQLGNKNSYTFTDSPTCPITLV